MNTSHPECIVGDGNGREVLFLDAWHLSWTTFSTVGYGALSVGHSGSTESSYHCMGTNVLMAYEAFLGVLFGSISSAVIFGKVTKAQSIASVLFSHVICVRYGLGVQEQASGINGDSSDRLNTGTDNDTEEGSKIPCPVLQFRLINEFWMDRGGEIMNATINTVAAVVDESAPLDEMSKRRLRSVIEVNEQSQSHSNTEGTLNESNGISESIPPWKKISNVVSAAAAFGGTRSHKRNNMFGTDKTYSADSGNMMQRLHHSITHINRDVPGSENHELFEPYSEEDEPDREAKEDFQEESSSEMLAPSSSTGLRRRRPSALSQSVRSSTGSSAGSRFGRHAGITMSDGSEAIVPPLTFHKLKIETDTHPFFKRVWVIRHKLNESSPLLTARARTMIAENQGFWPEELNNHESVRQHLSFVKIVNFAGTANVSGRSVYAQKVFDFADVYVGYSFVNVLMRNSRKELVVDTELLNTVTVQNGGGGERLRRRRQAIDLTENVPANAAKLPSGRDAAEERTEADKGETKMADIFGDGSIVNEDEGKDAT